MTYKRMARKKTFNCERFDEKGVMSSVGQVKESNERK